MARKQLELARKQLELARSISQHNVSLFGLLKTKFKCSGLSQLYHNLCLYWCLTNNLAHHKGVRIIVWRNPTFLKVDVLCCSSQLIHLACKPATGHPFYCSFVYGFNDKYERLKLFQFLGFMPCAGPWIVLGDFNCVANIDERLGQPVRLHKVLPLRQCMT